MSRNRNRMKNASNRASQAQIIVDVNPQFMNMPLLQQTAINTVVENKVSTPVVNNVGQGGQALVMEILKIFFFSDAPDVIAGVEATNNISLNKKSKGTTAFPELNDPDVIMQDARKVDFIAASTGGGMFPSPISVYDLTDGAGNGYLYGGKELWLQMSTVNNAAAQTKKATAKVLYRMKQVNSNELVGILQE